MRRAVFEDANWSSSGCRLRSLSRSAGRRSPRSKECRKSDGTTGMEIVVVLVMDVDDSDSGRDGPRLLRGVDLQVHTLYAMYRAVARRKPECEMAFHEWL